MARDSRVRMASDDGKLILYCALGFGAGLYCFFKGFREYRKYRVLADTPEIPIRSIAMGLVEVHGKAQGEQLLTSPVTKSPCFLYKVDIDRWKTDSKGRGSWRHYKTDINGVTFYLRDGTGKVLVNAYGAELDLIRTVRRETGGIAGRGLRALFGGGRNLPLPAGPYVTDAELIEYVERSGTSGSAALPDVLKQLAVAGRFPVLRGSSAGRYRLTEYCILPDHWYDVTATCVENLQPKDADDRNLLLKGQNEPTFLISWRSEKGIEGTLRKRAALYVFGGAALAVVCLAILLAKFGMF
jgi:hypothetical protein